MKPLTTREVELLRSQGNEVRQVRPNRIALERMNALRRARGERELAMSTAAAVGEEVVGPGLRAPSSELASFSVLPSHVDNSVLDSFPPIRSQGSIGSCVAWATTYYQLSHTVALQYGWDAKHGTDNTRLFSPKWSYNFINNGVDAGSYISSAYNLLERHGATTWATIPYDSNYTSWPVDPAVWRGALPFRTNPVQYVTQVGTPEGMQRVKELLANGYVLVYGTYINSWQSMAIKNDPSTPEDDAFAGKAVAYWQNGFNGSHAMTIVGYDDTVWADINKNNVVDPGEKGALRIANSWGTGWNEGGFTWLAYDALRSVSAVTGGPSTGRVPAFQANLVYHLTVRPNYTPKLVAEVKVSHLRRNQLSLALGISEVGFGMPAATFQDAVAWGGEGGGFLLGEGEQDGGRGDSTGEQDAGQGGGSDAGTGGGRDAGVDPTVWSLTAIGYTGGPRAFNGSTQTAVDATFVLDFTDLLPAVLAEKRFLVRMTDTVVGDPAVLRSFRIVDVAKGDLAIASLDAPLTVDGATGHAHVDYTLVNRPPVITSATPAGRVKLGPAGSVQLAVLATDAEGQPLSYAWSVDGAPVGGNASSFTYAPAVVGTHSVRVAVSDGVGGVALQHWNVALNSRPLANSPSATLTEDFSKAFALTAFDADGDALTWTVVDPPAHGTLSGALPSPLYRPEANYAGTDSFTFQAHDGMESSPLAVATMTMTPVNDVPTVRIVSPAHGSSFAAPATVSFEVAASDVEGPVARVELYQGATKLGEDSAAPFTFQLDGLVAATYVISAKAYDASGAVSTASSIYVYVHSPTVSVAASDATGAEPGTDTGRFTISRSGGVAGQVLTVGYVLTGTATSGADFTPLSGSVTMAAGVNAVSVDVRPVDDAAVEGRETVVLTVTPDPTYKLGSTASGTVTLLDNEQPVVTVTASDSLGAEPGTDTVRFSVARTGPTTSALTVGYALSGTAAGTDYVALPGMVTIPAGSASANVVLTAVDDALVEGKETIILTLLEDATYQVHTSASATASLLDDEQPVVTVTASDAEAAEPSNPGAFTVTRTGPTQAPLTVVFAVSGSASVTSDYQALGTTVVIPAGAASAVLEVRPTDDVLVEAKEGITVTLAADAAYQLATSTSAAVNLFDDEKPELRITATDSAAGEANANGGLFSVTAIPAPKADLSISFTVTGTATQGTDYGALTAPLTVPAGATSVGLSVSPIDDAVKEGSETVVVTLTATAGYTVGTSGATVSVADND
ncbi:Calx-beta domain-containing protein [Pyxidicoccus xibeiensis]|uniref:Calx-beta domain-containing protein n=1 Tax=Pyxidicoccus xibeiensis TaxID=2906759 RepID=UPI0020A73DFA|nr:Calx-beta domain-containing protein [Pyxidicoccus xibeiensis]MCP3141841.1 Ig-like domain-containing protein [Pyxidicoccus xibeiensis]